MSRIPTCPDCGERRPVLAAPQRHQPTCTQADEGNLAGPGSEYAVAPSQIRALSAAGRRWFKAAMREKRLPALRRVQCEAAGETTWQSTRKVPTVTGNGKRARTVWRDERTDYRVRLYTYALPDGGRGELRLRVDEQGELLPEARAYLERVGAVAAPMPATQPEAPVGRDESPAFVSVAVEAVEARPGEVVAVKAPVRLTRMVSLHSARQGRRLEEPVPLTVVKRRPDDWGLAVEAARAWLASQPEAAKRRPCDG